jgi:triosephosphate isomerase
MSRKYLIAGNWKMNLTPAEGASLIKEVAQALGNSNGVETVVAPPFTGLAAASEALNKSSTIKLGAQNLYPKASGAYTGEVSPEMLKSLFVSFVILGHSERREYFAETDAFINEKVRCALEYGMKPILCIGETLQEREADNTLAVVKEQLTGGLQGVSQEQAADVVIAYEPVWAIGTGKTATPEMAEEVHASIRCELAGLYGAETAEKIRILYGGSMKPANAEGLLAQRNIDGGLIGGASLKAADFAALVEAARKA